MDTDDVSTERAPVPALAVLGLVAAAARGAGAMGGVLVGEGAYGLLTIADTTSPVYWTGSAVAGAALVRRGRATAR